MRLGVVLPTYPIGATVEGVVQVAQAADRLGFASIWTTDHVILPPDQAGPYAEILEPLMMLAYVAPLTSRVKLGISVIVVPQRNGVVLAKELATLDRLCQGRLSLASARGGTRPSSRCSELEIGSTAVVVSGRDPATVAPPLDTPELLSTVGSTHVPAAAFGPGPRCSRVDRQFGWWVVGRCTSSGRNLWAAWHPVGISPSDLAMQATLVQHAADAVGRRDLNCLPRLPLQFGARSEALAVGQMETIAGSPDEVVRQLRDSRGRGCQRDCLPFQLSQREYRGRADGIVHQARDAAFSTDRDP